MLRDKLIHYRGNHSQREMAERYKVSQQLWCAWEQGKRCPSPAMMLMLEKDSGVPMEELFYDSFNNLKGLKRGCKEA